VCVCVCVCDMIQRDAQYFTCAPNLTGIQLNIFVNLLSFVIIIVIVYIVIITKMCLCFTAYTRINQPCWAIYRMTQKKWNMQLYVT